MKQAVQTRTLKTRARLLEVSREMAHENGFEGLRVEEVVQRAGVAKGTFFAHFKDKDALMDLLVGARIDEILDHAAARPAPTTVDQLVARLMPMLIFMTSERYIFDVCLRLSGALAAEEIGVIATTFHRQHSMIVGWLSRGAFRADVSPELLADGVQAFATQSMALNFCALHNNQTVEERFKPYLKAWLTTNV